LTGIPELLAANPIFIYHRFQVLRQLRESIVSPDTDLFEEREQPPMSAEMFTTLVAARLRSGGIHADRQRKLKLTIRAGNGPGIAQLDSCYERYRADPAALTPLIQGFIAHISEGKIGSAAADPFEQAAHKLLPLLVTAEEWGRKREAGVRMVARPLVQDILVALVIDDTESYTFVEQEGLERWDVNTESAFDKALQNLEARARDIKFSQAGEGTGTLLVDRTGDGYAATRALLASRFVDWSKRVSGELILGIPNRDLMIGFGSQHPELETLAAQVKEDARTYAHGLSKELLGYRSGKLGIYRREGE
jgi:hypothetical protein